MTIARIPVLTFLLSLLFQPLLSEAQISVQNGNTAQNSAAPQARWVDSVYNRLNEQERIGQLFMVAAYSGGKDYNEDKITALLAAHQVGGLIFMQGSPETQVFQNNKFQQMAQVPLLIGMDAEWGVGMRLSAIKEMPRAMMIGATADTALAYQVGKAIAAQCKRLGVHINFAPVVDVNNNPNNPIINARSFGEDKLMVAKLAIAYMKGMQDNGVMACAKHFPGHGDTDVDSHKDMPAIMKSAYQLDTLELYPFRQMIKAGVKGMMVAHLEVPALETEPHIPATLSKNIVTNLLKTQLAFKGLVFTDALNMQGVAKYFSPGDVDLRAYLAGNDMLLFSQDVPTAIAKFQEALGDGRITPQQLEASVKKVLGAKYDAGLAKWKPININNVTTDLNKAVDAIRPDVAQASITLVRDNNKILDKVYMPDAQIGYIGVNASSTVLYQRLSDSMKNIKAGWLPRGSSQSAADKVETATAGNTVTIIGVHNLTFYPSGGDYGLDRTQLNFLKKMQARKDVMIVYMGNAYLLKHTCNVASAIVAYEDDDVTEEAAARVVLSSEYATGVLPVTPCPGMKQDMKAMSTAVAAKAADRLKKVDFVEDAGVVNPAVLDKLRMFLQRCIADGAFPGVQVVAAKNGKIFFDQNLGYTSYDKTQPVTENTIYDVASVTKVVSTTLAVMRLYEQKKLDLNRKVGDYLPWTKGTDKANLVVKDLLMHQAGLKSWIPFYKETLDAEGNLGSELYSKQQTEQFRYQVAKDLYLRSDYPDTVWKRILESPLENKGKYVYSDLDYFFLAAIVQQVTGQGIDKYVEEQFYKPLGLKRTTYVPLKKFKVSEIAPTENDMLFRHQLVRGYVHDQAAALFGGVAGHAGVFSTANEVAVIFQMLLNGGTYGGKRFFTKETVNTFTAYNSRISRRALGFDKPSADRDDAGPAGNRVSGYAFGHQGFTGTCAWADPATGVVFVFLSNRVNPSAENGAINKLSVRTVSQDYIYEALGIPLNRERPQVQQTQMTTAK